MNESKAARYQRRNRRRLVTGWAMASATLALLAFSPAGATLYAAAVWAAAVLPAGLQAPAASVLFVALSALLCELAALPAALRRPSDDGAARSGRLPWWLTHALAAGAATSAAVVAAVLVLATAQLAGAAWWLLATALLSAVLALVLRTGPRILGVGGTVRPLSRPALAARLAELAGHAGVPVAEVAEWHVDEPGAPVAVVTGTGRRRQILLASDVVRDWRDDEVVAVVAHELAHLAHGDLLRSFGLNVLVLGVGLLASDVMLGVAGSRLGIAGAADPVGLPLIAFSALSVWLLATPIRHAQSRQHERRADQFALALTGRADAFAVAVRRAGARRLMDDRPTRLTSWLFHRHPSMAERLALAERFGRGETAGR